LLKHLHELLALPAAERLKRRYEKYRAYGHFLEKARVPAEKVEQPVNGAAAGAKATTAPADAAPAA
jgi:hypothetical protein